MRKKTHEEYVAELAIKNPTIEVIEKYNGIHKKILHHCLVHDIYCNLEPANALRGDGCEICHKERIGLSNCKSHEQYVKEVNDISPHIIVIGKYVNINIPILHFCTVHNVEWEAYPNNILRGCGCCECGNNKISEKQRRTHEQYIEKVKEINPDIEVVGQYINAKTPILHKCKIDGYTWYAIPDVITHGYGCPQCNESSGERQVRQWLDKHNIEYEYQKVFNDCRNKHPLPFDFYLPNYNLCIEFDGGQHYKPVDKFGGYESFQKTVEHDKIKNNYCLNNNIKLLRIPYFKNIEEELNNFLFI